MLDGALTVFRKEVLDNIRDKRTVLLGLVYPLIGPLLLGALIMFVGNMVVQPSAREKRLWMEGAEHAPALVEHLKSNGVTIEEPTEDPELLVRTGKIPLVLVVPPDYETLVAGDRTARVKMIVDPSRLGSIVAIGRTLDLVQQYNRILSKERFARLRLDPEIAEVIKVETVSVAGGRAIASIFLNMLPPFLIFTVFIGGVYLAIDTTAGERERGSLEPLLINPVPRWQLMLGKFGASLVFTAVAVAAALFAYKLMFHMVVLADVGIKVNPGVGTFVMIFVLALPIMAFAVALQVIVATITRSFKETQTYLGLLPLVPSLPGMIMVFAPVTGKLWMMAIPTLGQTVLFGALMRGDPVDPLHAAVAVLSTLTISIALLAAAAHFYEHEQVAFPA
ncbi:MAG: ABC transporter permease [Alphaproteobacteria bacterium]|nr:ABC transporter permease [Alphaproteobacteria bacterium]